MRRSRIKFVGIAVLAIVIYKVLGIVSPAAQQSVTPGSGEEQQSEQNAPGEDVLQEAQKVQEQSLAEQIAAVRRGDSVAIRLITAECTDADLAAIGDVPEIRQLNLARGSFTDVGLAHLTGLQNLELLRFSSPHVTDAGLKTLVELKSLRFLHLIHVPVTDAGLQSLHGMTQLESFYLDGGRATDTGLQALLTALPELHFHKDQLHLPGDQHGHEH